MLGHDHALSGALAFAAVAPLLHVSGPHLAAAITLTAGGRRPRRLPGARR